MKKNLTILWLLLGPGQWAGNQLFAQANVNLSNLSSTSVNADLIPSATNLRLLGNSVKGWKQLYVTDAVYLSGGRFLSFGTSTTFDATAVGFKVLASNVGAANTGLGFSALSANTKGDHNTALGNSSMLSNTTGRNNAALGSSSLFNNTTGAENVAFGHGAMLLNTAGNSNTSLGAFSLLSNNAGYGNIAIGSHALYKNSVGWSSVAIGDSALYNQSGTMGQNVAIGSMAMKDLSVYSYNTAVGTYAFTSGGGEGNVAVGWGALESGLDENTAVGFDAGLGGGLNSTFIGSHAGGGSNPVNSTAIGAYSAVTGDNQVRLGNSSTTSIGGAVSWSVVSDARFKRNIKANVPGLEFIKALRPVTYNYDPAAMRRFVKGDLMIPAGNNSTAENRNAETALTKAEQEKAKEVFTGFVAQEVEAAARKMNYEFSGVDAPKSDKEYYGLRLADFIAPMVQAIKELSDRNDSLQARIDRMELERNGGSGTAKLTDANLGGNVPNPFGGSTNISYTLPFKYGKAKLVITDMAGKLIKSVPVTGNGRGNLAVDAAALSAGVYNYTLYVDDEMISTKQMIRN